jgi:Raf kinase inhibitor-like YbhB/YbcL family protein
MVFAIRSTSFQDGSAIPTRFTQDGDDVSPAVSWSEVPEGTESLALIVDDPDAPDPAAPKMTFVHWVVYDVPPDTKGLAEGASGSGLPAGAKEGKNDAGSVGYVGPAPPKGKHRYFFKVYALDTTLGLSEPTKKDLEKAMQGHVLAQARIIGTYQRAGREAA